jgi:tetratricopeptide (TPR) repeat protein
VAAGGGVDRTQMRIGDRAFSREAWLEATEAYQRMPEPVDEMDEYGRAFLDAKIQQGVAHVNRSEFGRALEIFEEAVEIESPGPDAYLHLAEAQCAVGRSEEGRGTLSQLSRARSGMRPVQQSYVAAMIAYRRAVCSNGEFDRAETTRDRVRAGAQATQELNAFVEGARAMSPVPPDVYNAVLDAERRVLEIRRLMGGGR